MHGSSTCTRQARGVGKPVVLAGCVPQGDRHLEELQGLSVLGLQQIERVVEVVEQTLQVGHHSAFSARRQQMQHRSC